MLKAVNKMHSKSEFKALNALGAPPYEEATLHKIYHPLKHFQFSIQRYLTNLTFQNEWLKCDVAAAH